jgi:hypothetical protein
MEIRTETFSYDSEGNWSSIVRYSIKAKDQSSSVEEIGRRISEKKKEEEKDDDNFFVERKKKPRI